MRSGATQWRHDCTCNPEVAEERHTQEWERMHSQVSKANAQYFVREDRVSTDVSEAELKRMVDQTDGAIIVCNVCGDLKEVDVS